MLEWLMGGNDKPHDWKKLHRDFQDWHVHYAGRPESAQVSMLGPNPSIGSGDQELKVSQGI